MYATKCRTCSNEECFPKITQETTTTKTVTYRPRILMASTLSPASVSSVMIVCTHSYNIAFPAFFAVSVLLATYGLIK